VDREVPIDEPRPLPPPPDLPPRIELSWTHDGLMLRERRRRWGAVGFNLAFLLACAVILGGNGASSRDFVAVATMCVGYCVVSALEGVPRLLVVRRGTVTQRGVGRTTVRLDDIERVQVGREWLTFVLKDRRKRRIYVAWLPLEVTAWLRRVLLDAPGRKRGDLAPPPAIQALRRQSVRQMTARLHRSGLTAAKK